MIEQTYKIEANVESVWAALVDPEIIEQWSGSEAIMDDQEGTKFELWDGEMHGTNTKVVENKILEQDWFGGDWDEPSKVRFELESSDEYTLLHLTQENVPEDEESDFASGWQDYYCGAIKELLED